MEYYVLTIIFICLIFNLYLYWHLLTTYNNIENNSFDFYKKESFQLILLLFINTIISFLICKVFTDLIEIIPLIVIFSLVITGVFIDFQLFILPNKITTFIILLSVLFLSINPFIELKSGLFGGVIAFLFFFILSFFGMGMGDAKLMLGLGLLVGLEVILVSIFIGFLIGSIQGISLWIINGYNKHMRMPFGPALSIGTFIATLIMHGNLFNIYSVIGIV